MTLLSEKKRKAENPVSWAFNWRRTTGATVTGLAGLLAISDGHRQVPAGVGVVRAAAVVQGRVERHCLVLIQRLPATKERSGGRLILNR